MVTSDGAEAKIASIPPFGLRMQSGLKRRVEEAAKANGRSLNSEIVARLEQSFREEGRAGRSFLSPDQEKRQTLLEDIWASLMFDERLETIANRLAALEKRFGEQSTGDLS